MKSIVSAPRHGIEDFRGIRKEVRLDYIHGARVGD
jgi:hydrogenase maturation factor